MNSWPSLPSIQLPNFKHESAKYESETTTRVTIIDVKVKLACKHQMGGSRHFDKTRSEAVCRPGAKRISCPRGNEVPSPALWRLRPPTTATPPRERGSLLCDAGAGSITSPFAIKPGPMTG